MTSATGNDRVTSERRQHRKGLPLEQLFTKDWYNSFVEDRRKVSITEDYMAPYGAWITVITAS